MNRTKGFSQIRVVGGIVFVLSVLGAGSYFLASGPATEKEVMDAARCLSYINTASVQDGAVHILTNHVTYSGATALVLGFHESTLLDVDDHGSTSLVVESIDTEKNAAEVSIRDVFDGRDFGGGITERHCRISITGTTFQVSEE